MNSSHVIVVASTTSASVGVVDNGHHTHHHELALNIHHPTSQADLSSQSLVSDSSSPSNQKTIPISGAKALFFGRYFGTSPSSENHPDHHISSFATEYTRSMTREDEATVEKEKELLDIETEPVHKDVEQGIDNDHKFLTDNDEQLKTVNQEQPHWKRKVLNSFFFWSKPSSSSSTALGSSTSYREGHTRRSTWFSDMATALLSFQNSSNVFSSSSNLTSNKDDCNRMSDMNSTSPLDIDSNNVENASESDSFYLTSYCFNLFQTLRTSTLNTEYAEYSVQQRSMTVVLGYAIFFGVSLVWAVLAPLNMNQSHPHFMTVFILSTCSCFCNFIDTILALIVCYRQTKHFITSSHTTRLSKFIKQYESSIHIVLFLSMTLSYCTRLLAKTIGGDCGAEDVPSSRPWTCNPYQDIHQLPMDTAMAMMFTPIAYPAIFRECRMDICMLSFCLVIFSFLISSYWIHSTLPLYFISVYVFLCGFIVMELPRQNLMSFIAHKKYQAIILEKQKMMTQAEVEMRHILGNVAHDFKTPLSSFMNGVDLIGHTMDDFEMALCDHQESMQSSSSPNTIPSMYTVNSSLKFQKECRSLIKSMRTIVHDVRSTNSFMLMTINRCLDFTKVSKGMKLIPKYETIDLIETIAMPINCMKNIQNRVSMRLQDISGLICSHIITDKQWLQENILCLLSNAVKYSTGGEVTITISLQKYRNGDIPEEDEISKAKFISVPKGTSSQEVSKLKLKHVDTFASKSHPQASFNNNNNYTIPSDGNGSIVTVAQESTTTEQQDNSSTTTISFVSIFVSWWNRLIRNTCWWFPGTNTYSSPNKTQHIKVIPLHQCDHYLIPHDEEGSNSGNSGRTNGSDSSRRRNSRRIPHAFTSIPQQGKGFLLIEVEDHGIGISEEAMKGLFAPFKQTQRLAGGTGLGLFSLAKRIEAKRGSYGVKKRKDGQKGSLFWFSIPYRPDMLLAKSYGNGYARDRMHEINDVTDIEKRMRSYSEDNNVPEKVVLLTKREKSTSMQVESIKSEKKNNDALDTEIAPTLMRKPISRLSSSVRSSSSYMNTKIFDILVAEDSPTISKMVKMILSRQGHKVTIAENGEEVLTLVNKRLIDNLSMFDVILMDMQMPVMDGLEATRRLRLLEEEQGSKRNLSFKVIGLSANSDEESTQQAFEAGIDSFIPKPFDFASFMTVMQGFEENNV